MLGAYGFLRAMFEVFERHEVVVDVLASGEVSVSLTVEDRSRLEPVIRELSELGEVWIDDRRAIVSVVGIGLRTTPGLASRIFRAVPPANVEVISQGASAINMTFVVREEDGRTRVEVMDPRSVLQLVERPEIGAIASEVRQRLERVVAAL